MEEYSGITEYHPYLEEIRRRIYVLALVVIGIFIIGFFAAGYIIRFGVSMFNVDNVVIATTSPFQYVELATSVGIVLAMVVTAPLAVYHLYAFLRPALNSKEKSIFFKLLPFSLLLFVIGFSYGAATMLFAFKMVAALNTTLGLSNIWDISKFFSQIIVTSAFLGVLFEFPLLLTFLIRISLVERTALIRYRRWAYLVIFIVVALLPPTDGISLLATALPLIAIYELTIIFNRQNAQPVKIEI